MRCPKCSYISFDMIETCVKCGKNISNAATELEGTVASVPSPSFLRVPGKTAPPGAVEEDAEVGAEGALDLGAEGEEEEMEISLDDEPTAGVEEHELDLGGEEESEAALDLGAEEIGTVEAAESEVDFGLDEEVETEPEVADESAIGISDLAPSEEGEKVIHEEPVGEKAKVAAEGGGLESLEVDMDLEPGVTDEPGKVMPSVKTGTALDDFDIDLGDLITGKDDD